MNCLLLLIAAFSQTITAPQLRSEPWVAARVDVQGQGFNGTDIGGPMVQFVNCDGFRLGSGDPFRATGGRIERLKVIKHGTGGTAIALRATSAGERPGECVIRDVKIMGYSDLRNTITSDNWETGLLVDGGNLNEVNAAGIRCVDVDGLRVAGCLGPSVDVKNATHFRCRALQVDPGSAGRVPQVTVEDSRHVFFTEANVFGEVHFRECKVVRFDGYAQVLRVDAKCADVTITGTVGKLDIAKGAKRINVNGVGVVR